MILPVMGNAPAQYTEAVMIARWVYRYKQSTKIKTVNE